MIERVKTANNALIRYSFTELSQLRKKHGIISLSDVVSTEYPTLRDISIVFGRFVSEALIETHIVYINDMSNVQRLNDKQVVQLKELLYEQLKYEKLTTINEFFKRILSGHYDKFFGAIDISKIMSDCHRFKADLHRVEFKYRQKKEKEKEDQRQERLSEWIERTYEEVESKNKNK